MATPSPILPMRRVLVVTKFKYMGDTIVATPLLRDISHGRPDAEITVLGGPVVPTLLEGCPYVTQVWSADPSTGSNIGLSGALIKRIRDERFDTAILVNRSLHSAALACFARIPNRVGHNTEHRGLFLTRAVKYDWNKPDRECALDLARAVGIQTGSSIPQLWLNDLEKSNANAALSKKGISPDKRVVALHPGAHESYVREWGVEKFAELGTRLAEELDAAVVLLGSAEERKVCENVAAAMKLAPAVLTGETTLRETFAIISLCSLWVGNDGGMLHAAVALNVPTIGIFGPTKAPRWSYDAPKHKTLVKYPGSYRGKPDDMIRNCLDQISVDDAFEAAVKVF